MRCRQASPACLLRAEPDGALAITYRPAEMSFEQLLERVKSAGITIRDQRRSRTWKMFLWRFD